MTAQPRERAQPALLSGWVSVCYRCGHTWVEACRCVAFLEGELPDAGPIHSEGDCQPPARCPKCGSTKWWEGH